MWIELLLFLFSMTFILHNVFVIAHYGYFSDTVMEKLNINKADNQYKVCRNLKTT